MSALGCFGRFTLFSPRVSHSNTCRLLSFVCFVLLFGFVALVCFCFLFLLCCVFGSCFASVSESRILRGSLDLDDRQGLIARSAMQQKKKKDVPLLDPTVDFSGPRAPGSFFPVKDVWVPYYWFLRQTSRITCLNGFNRGTPAGREPDIKNVHHIDGSKPFLEACKQAFLFGFPRLFSLSPLDDCPPFCKSPSLTHSQLV